MELERERVLLDFVDPRTNMRNRFSLIDYDGDKAAIIWTEKRAVYSPCENKIVEEWWEKDMWVYNSWVEAEMAIIYINGDCKYGTN